MIHFANAKKSNRLRKVLSYLKDRGNRGATTRDLVEATGQVAINSIAAELRAQGYRISCTFQGRSLEGNSIFRYRWER